MPASLSSRPCQSDERRYRILGFRNCVEERIAGNRIPATAAGSEDADKRVRNDIRPHRVVVSLDRNGSVVAARNGVVRYRVIVPGQCAAKDIGPGTTIAPLSPASVRLFSMVTCSA